ncbi:MAG: NHL repeat-containing protein [Anaerolineae bacterium]
MRTFTDLGEPCRNFNILAVTRIYDPRDQRVKVVLSSYVAEGVGCLVFIDPTTGQGETVLLPGDSGAWALLPYGDRLLVGTCATYGYLLSLDLASRSWAKPLRVDSETYVWQLCLGSDGMVYGGTWPGCSLLRYDPRTHTLVDLGKASDAGGNCYSRYVYGQVPGKILIECGHAERHLALYDITSAAFTRFGQQEESVIGFSCDRLYTQVGDERFCYTLPELEPVSGAQVGCPGKPALPYASEFIHYVNLADERLCVVRGQSYYLLEPGVSEPELLPIPAERPPTAILGLCAAPDGTLWGSSAFGQTIFSFNPFNGNTWNSEVVCDQGGEVYGMAWLNGRLFMSSYSHGDHIVYDPTLPWDQLHNLNPRTLESAAPQLVRPGARSIVGPDGGFYTGWWAAYGVYGGGITRVDPRTLAVTTWHDLVPGESVVGLAGDDEDFYLVTTQRANGLPEHSDTGHLAVWNPGKGIVDQVVLQGSVPDWGVCADPRGAVVVWGNALHVYDRTRRGFHDTLNLPERFSYLLRQKDGTLLVFGQRAVFSFNSATVALEVAGEIPGPARSAVQAPDGKVYIACGSHLYRLS